MLLFAHPGFRAKVSYGATHLAHHENEQAPSTCIQAYGVLTLPLSASTNMTQ